jgi:hypothetical protein
MAMTLRPGARLFSSVCATELITVRTPAEPIELTIGGAEPVTSAAARTGEGQVLPGHDGGALLGKRYVDDAGTLELMCTKPGPGVPAVGGTLLELKEAKALPSSD